MIRHQGNRATLYRALPDRAAAKRLVVKALMGPSELDRIH